MNDTQLILLHNYIKEAVNQPIYGRFYNWKYYHILGCNNNCILNILKMMEQMKKCTNTLIELFLMVMLWTCIWSLRKENIVILILMILHVMVTYYQVFFITIYPSNRLEFLFSPVSGLCNMKNYEVMGFHSRSGTDPVL